MRRVFQSAFLAILCLVAAYLPTLLRYAARDSDRSMLFGAELPVSVP